MLNWILLGIYIYGCILLSVMLVQEVLTYRRAFTMFSIVLNLIIPRLIGISIWPVFWMHNFIKFYLTSDH